MKWIKNLIVFFLFTVCTLLDAIPSFEEGRWWRYGDWGCRFRLASRAFALKGQWHTGAMKPESLDHRSLYE